MEVLEAAGAVSQAFLELAGELESGCPMRSVPVEGLAAHFALVARVALFNGYNPSGCSEREIGRNGLGPLLKRSLTVEEAFLE